MHPVATGYRRHGPIPPPCAPSRGPAAWIGAAVPLLALWLAGCASTHTPPPPYGILTYDHTHGETLDPTGKTVVARNCHTHVEGGVETTGAALQGQSCGDTIGGETTGVTAFAGQAIGANIWMAKVKADAARDQALIAGGYQLGSLAACAGMIAATPAAAAACLQAVKGATPGPPNPGSPPASPPPAERPAMLEAPDPPADPSLPAPGVHRAHGHVRTVLHAQGGAMGAVWYRDEDGHPHVASLREWRTWGKG